MPGRLISSGYFQRASYSRKPVGAIIGSRRNSQVLGVTSGAGGHVVGPCQRVRLGQPVEGHQRFDQRRHPVERDHVRPVRGGAVGVLMRLDEHPRDAEATAARAITGANSRCPPDAPPSPPGCCTEWVASMITG
jgi:hypothetical protein